MSAMTAFDFEPICFANMPLASYDDMAHVSDSEFTLRPNRRAAGRSSRAHAADRVMTSVLPDNLHPRGGDGGCLTLRD
jgi:hypothetical protein